MQSKWAELRKLPLGSLRIDTRYQRNINPSWVRYIIKNFDEDLVGVPQISYRDGTFYILDGQHTVKALSVIKQNPDYPVVCKVYYGLTAEEEATMFHKFNTSKKRINAFSVVKAKAASGDEDIVKFLRITKTAGFVVDPSRHCRYGIRAIRKAQKCYSSLGIDGYMFMLKMLKKTWKGEAWSVSENMLSGMEILTRVFYEDLAQFSRVMSKFTDDDINREAAEYYDLSMPYRYAWAIGTLFNSKGGELDLNLLSFVAI